MLPFLSRRRFVVGVAACCTCAPAFAQGKPHRIDLHHHIVAPAWLEALRKAKLDTPPIDNWTPERSIEDMDKAGVATAVTSPTTPQVGFLGADEAAHVARVERVCATARGGPSWPLWGLRHAADAAYRQQPERAR
jgi:6-methylsalicylate decarboxylase